MKPSFVPRTEEFTFAVSVGFGSLAAVQFEITVLEKDDVRACYGVGEFVRITVVLKEFDFTHGRPPSNLLNAVPGVL